MAADFDASLRHRDRFTFRKKKKTKKRKILSPGLIKFVRLRAAYVQKKNDYYFRILEIKFPISRQFYFTA